MDETNITEYRTKRLTKKLVADIESILLLVKTYQKGLEVYKVYVPVQDLLTTLRDAEKTLHSYLEKLKKTLNES